MISYAIERVERHYPNASRDEIKSRLELATFVNLDRRYLYYEVPKAGCTSIKTLIHKLEKLPSIDFAPPEVRRDMYIHSRGQFGMPSLLDLTNEQQERVLTSPDFFRFSVVRNPYTRLVSAWKDKIWLCAPGFEAFYERLRGRVPERFEPKDLIKFSEFVDLIREENLSVSNPHWRLQNQYIFPAAMNFSKIGKLERLHETLAEFCARANYPDFSQDNSNKMNSSLAAGEYNQELAEIVFNLYRSDFEIFSYDRNNWPRSTPDRKVIDEGKFGVEIAERNVVISKLYHELEKSNFSISGVVDVCYRKILGRVSDETGRKYYEDIVVNLGIEKGLEFIISDLLNSKEGREHVVRIFNLVA
jgi:hypothetical protein